MKLFTLPDLADKKNLAEWLGADGNPPTVYVETVSSRARWYNHGSSGREPQTVTDENTAAIWWSNHRQALAEAWSKSKENKHKPQSWTQFLAECLSSIGIKKVGTVAERVERAKIMFPSVYSDNVKEKTAAEVHQEYQAKRQELNSQAQTAEAAVA